VIARERIFRVGERIVKCSPDNLKALLRGLKLVENVGDGVEEIRIDEIPIERVECRERWKIEEIERHLGLIDLNDPTKAHHIAVIVGKDGMVARATDVSRHNAILKVLGMCSVDLSRVFLLTSSRVTFDLAYLCCRAKVPVLVTKKSVTDLALEVCKRSGMTLVSFGNRIIVGDNVECGYSGWRKG